MVTMQAHGQAGKPVNQLGTRSHSLWPGTGTPVAELETDTPMVPLGQGMKAKLKLGSWAHGQGVWMEAPGEAGHSQ